MNALPNYTPKKILILNNKKKNEKKIGLTQKVI